MNLLETIENIPGCDIFEIFTDNSFEFIKAGTQYVVTQEQDYYTISGRYYGMQIYDTPEELLNHINQYL